MKTAIGFFFISFCSIAASAQEWITDSVIQKYLTGGNDTFRLIAYSKLAEDQAEINPDSSFHYAEKVLLIARKMKLKLEEVYALGQMGYALMNIGNYPRSLQTHLSGIAIAEDPASEKNILSDYYPEVDELNRRRGSPKSQRLDKLARMHQYVGILYGNANNYEKEKANYFLARQVAEQTGNIPLKSIINGTIGRVYLALRQTDSALYYEQMAYSQALQSGYKKYRGSILLNLARVHSAIGNRDLAVEYFKKALESSREQNYLRGVVSSNLYLADLYLKSGNRDSGFYFINEAGSVAHQLNAPSLRSRVYTALANYYRDQGQSDSIVKYQDQIIKINDSLFSTKQVQQFQNIDFDQQQLRLEKEASEKEYRYRLRLYGLLTGLAIFLLLVLNLWRNNRNKQKAFTLLQKQKQETDFQKAKVEMTLSELKAAQALLIQSEKMASLGELTAGIAHEIQNPLNFVNNFSEVNKELLAEMNEEISKGNYPEVQAIARDVTENQEKINFHGKRADAIVKSMLLHSRTSTGRQEPTDINELADEYLRLSYHGLRAKDKSFNAKFETDFGSGIAKINIIPQDIGRVILNLINNAFYAVSERKKHSKDGYEPTVRVSTKKMDDRVEIRVKDNGNGIPASVREKIFQPFFTTKPTGLGTGLGLSLSYDIIKSHGGELKMETKEGEGTDFIILLPA